MLELLRVIVYGALLGRWVRKEACYLISNSCWGSELLWGMANRNVVVETFRIFMYYLGYPVTEM